MHTGPHQPRIPVPRPGLMPQDLADLVARLARIIMADGNADLFGPWAVAMLANKMGITVAMSSALDPVEAMLQVGEGWASQVAVSLEAAPGRRAEAVAGVQHVLEQVMEEVRGRGPQA